MLKNAHIEKFSTYEGLKYIILLKYVVKVIFELNFFSQTFCDKF